ncbi:SPRY domain containing protein [Entamoeba histolytica HM-1:IMSS-B]|uniref:SPRY domain-containing protein 7 n=4 Tax=Entamoeba histolytica TaxID=5759 RepID=C4LZG6_ENTH1|nr:uncharacterized protein EHI_138060 [Entamoeba histolytica HM-1:IMSS]EAL50524.1 hypothetical protein, conserved domain containing [Entamoeba histolytica HM-1:IMSS]EMH74889.1 SPRY domain containing protein [Entamoeba histolytica HM-1:IMSS-B]ENY64848.1 SPRY domain containing protein [Entamoeba histolytica HM-1:IMSS-A]GAT94256.1 hypothetical protein conserved domain containing [Entamoeba histolytica]|eukprot:XP_655908.1 uncharacterized protein EHI_138060 [Entamoeba histolytica HM-1:IMSS]
MEKQTNNLGKIINTLNQKIEDLSYLIQIQNIEFTKELRKRDEKINSLEKEIQYIKQLKCIEEGIKEDNDYAPIIANKLHINKMIVKEKETKWKEIFEEFVLKEYVSTVLIPNKNGVLISSKKWNKEKKPIMINNLSHVLLIVTNHQYFEISIQSAPPKLISFGVVSSLTYKEKVPIGQEKESIGFDSNGTLLLANGLKKKIARAWKSNDVVGCGYDAQESNVYFTLNGKKIIQVSTVFSDWYPAIQPSGFTQFTTNFGETPFVKSF